MNTINKSIQFQFPKIIIPENQNRNILPNIYNQIINPSQIIIPNNNYQQRIFFPDFFYLKNMFYQNFFYNEMIKNKKVNEEVENDNNILLNKKKKRNGKLCTNCPHKFSPHYAKGMCSNCYHSKGRIKKPWNCPHVNKAHYALGLCQNCYQIEYIKKQSEIHGKKFLAVNLTEEEKNNKEKNDVCLK